MSKVVKVVELAALRIPQEDKATSISTSLAYGKPKEKSQALHSLPSSPGLLQSLATYQQGVTKIKTNSQLGNLV
jgi:hypothetical protein